MKRLVTIVLCLLAGCRFDPSGLGGGGNGVDGSLRDGAPGDGAPGDGPRTDTGACPTLCTSCNMLSSTCIIDCGGKRCETGTSVVCPPGWNCRIDCIGQQACRTGPVTCSGSCAIVCSGDQACENGAVTCSGGPCDIRCEGQDTCDNGVRCNGTSCNIACIGTGACEDKGTCCSNVSCGLMCTSALGGNCNCPQ